jgi:GrpB-like predicted nucleotidyltransferase (UPF0157 family)
VIGYRRTAIGSLAVRWFVRVRRVSGDGPSDVRPAPDDVAKLGCVAAEPIAVVPYDPDWQARFEAERLVLERVLAPWLEGGIHHIGSTAVPGLAAKAVIDVLAGVRDLEQAQAAFEPLRAQSYLHDPHRAEVAHHFAKPSLRLSETTYGLHLTEPGSDLWQERLAFRDALRAEPALAAEYEGLKLRLAREHADDIRAYTRGKRDFVARVLVGAGIELRHPGAR